MSYPRRVMFQIQASDGGVYDVVATERSVVALVMALTGVSGKYSDGKKWYGILSLAKDPRHKWEHVTHDSWREVTATCSSLQVIRLPHDVVQDHNSFKQLQDLFYESMRRMRSLMVESAPTLTSVN